MRISEWQAGLEPRPLTFAEAAAQPAPDGAFRCIEVAFGSSPAAVHADLSRLCGPRLSGEMVIDLLESDPLPKVHSWPATGIRSVSTFGIRALEDASSNRGLRFEIVEFLASDEWLIVCCHTSEGYASDSDIVIGTERGCESLLECARSRWAEERGRTSGDLGVLVLKHLAKSYRHARKHLERWIESWELDFYRHREVEIGEERARLDRLIQLRGLIAQYRERLTALNVERDEAAESWFANATANTAAESADRLIDESLAGLRRLSDMVRASFELHQSQTAARHLELSLEQQEAAERLQGRVELIGSAFLVPTLIAGIFGANTALPGGNDPHRWLGFELMLVAMVVGALTVAFVLKRMRDRNREADRRRTAARLASPAAR
jgi:hypothetical protein